MVTNWLTRLALAAVPLALVTLPATLADALDPAPTRFMIHLADPGVYRVTWEELQAAGLVARDLPSDSIGLTHRDTPVPIAIDDGGDGRFGPGDRVLFVGEHLAGDHSWYSEHSPSNVYTIDTASTAPARFTTVSSSGEGICRDRTRLATSRRFERDLLRMRFDAQDDPHDEVWYWHKLTHIDDEPFTQALDMSDLERVPAQPVRLRIHLRGWSRLPIEQRGSLPDHRVEVRIGDRLIGGVEWNNSADGQLLEIAESSSTFVVGENRLTLSIPPRQPPAVAGTEDDDPPPVVDVVLVNWIELSYTRNTAIGTDQTVVAALRTADCIDLQTSPGTRLALFREDGVHVDAGRGQAETGNHKLLLGADDRLGWPADVPLHLVRDNAYATPTEVRAARTLDASRDRQADYVMIVHPRLLEATRPLADFYRGRGLRVELVDVTEIYDTWNGGIVHPAAIKTFLGHAWRDWPRPAPRYVLLVGDASWDNRNAVANDDNYADKVYREHHRTRLPKNRSTAYRSTDSAVQRNLVPTWAAGTREGLAANDSWFADVEGDDGRPEMAVGRFPVVTPEEVRAIVDKSIAFASGAPVGPWRRRLLWITNEYDFSRQRSDRLAATMGERGYAAAKVYPDADEPSNETNRERLLEAFDAGNLLVHFFGHGGRYIWRTGPPDRKKNHDLFTLDDLEALTPNPRLPVVLSMTCYSAPFDHPNADSIGEKFLRLPNRGAIAVIAAAWRNSPSLEMSLLLLDAMTRPGTVGDAFLNAKRKSTTRDFLTQYNLLGDPAVPMPVPARAADIEFLATAPLRIRARTDLASFRGRAVVDWLDTTGALLRSEEADVADNVLEATFDGDARDVAAVRVYLWDVATAVDAMGAATVPDAALTQLEAPQ